MEIKPLKIKWYGRFGIATVIASTLFMMIWIFSKFREPPKISSWFTILLILMAFICLEAVRAFQMRFYNRSLLHKRKPFYILIFLGSICTGILVYTVLFYFFKWLDHYVNGSEVPMKSHMIAAVLIGAIMSVIFALIQFALNWKNEHYNAQFENETFKKEIAKANLALLKNQLDPHFMFNNFNTLYYLIEEDTVLAREFLKNVSTVYRYILQNNEKPLIPAALEYEMAKRYLTIMEQRYKNALQVKDTVEHTMFKDKYIPPLVLQQLIENAIKHNRIDKEKPLTINFEATGEELIISNTNNAKSVENKTGFGLENIKKRYAFLTDKAVVIAKTEEEFRISVPLIKNDNAG